MPKIVYYVASSIDGFISGPGDDISGFVGESDGIQRYLDDLKMFKTVIMGRKTYEFGYKYGLQPGKPAYPHMKHYIFSNHFVLRNPDPLVEIRPLQIEEISEIRNLSETDIYLCGGGQFAGWLLDNQSIDVLKLKLNPFLQGQGTRIFGESPAFHKLELLECSGYSQGLQIITYNICY